MRTALLSTLLGLYLPAVCALSPVLVASNGTTLVSSILGADLVLDAGRGTVHARSLLSAGAGVQLNGTTLSEPLLASLAALVATQSSALAQIADVFTVQANALTLQNLAANLSARVASQQVLVEEAVRIVNSSSTSLTSAVNAALASQAAAVAAALLVQQRNVSALLTAATDLVNSTATLQTQLLAPPKCTAPGGDKLQFTGAQWLCVCVPGYKGATCETPPSPPPPSPSPPPPLPPSPPPSPPPPMSPGLKALSLPDGSQSQIWVTEDADKSKWLLLFGSPATDKWCFGDARWTSATDIQAANLLTAQSYANVVNNLVLPQSASKLALINSLAAFDGVRVVAGGQPFDFTFGSVNTVANLMFTTKDRLLSGPTFSQWIAKFEIGRTQQPSFERGGSCANSTLPCVSRFGCGQPMMFGYQASDGLNTVSSGIGTHANNCGGGNSCGVARGDYMGNPGSVFILGRLSSSASVIISA